MKKTTTMTGPEIVAQYAARVEQGLCGNCGAKRVTATMCRPCNHRHYCETHPSHACLCDVACGGVK